MAEDAAYDHINRKLRNLEHCALHRRTITVVCKRCQRVRRFDAVALWWLSPRRGWDDGLPDAATRFRCFSCSEAGRRGAVDWQITRDRADDDQPPYPDESTWKRLVSRYRS